MTAIEAASEGIIVRKGQFDPQAGIDWYNQLIRDFNAKDAQLAAKDAQIAALREALNDARCYVQEEVEYGACSDDDKRVFAKLDAALEMSGGVL